MCLVDELERRGGQFQWGDGPSQGHGECATHSGSEKTQELTRYQGRTAPSGMVKERGRGGVVQNFQTGGSDPAKQVISERVRGNESVPRWVVSIEVSEDESVRGVRKDVRIEGPGARIRRTVSDGGE